MTVTQNTEKGSKTLSKADQLNKLFSDNSLLREDWFEHSQYRIIARSGIEKIQYKNNVTVHFEVIKMERDFCVVKAVATKGSATIETFGSAGHNANGEYAKGKQYQYLYYPEMAEKRALSRAILKICNFYELGVFGEDESPDFRANQSTTPGVTAPPLAKKEEISTSTIKGDAKDNFTPDPNVVYATTGQKQQITDLLQHPSITKDEKVKMLINVPKMTEERALEAIEKLKSAIIERQKEATS